MADVLGDQRDHRGQEHRQHGKVKVGVWNSGSPIHGAAAIPEVSTSPRISASTYPVTTAGRSRAGR